MGISPYLGLAEAAPNSHIIYNVLMYLLCAMAS